MKLEVIIAPLVVFLVMVVLLITARFYDHLPIKPPNCTFKRVTGIPCVACRGTRSLRALSEGKVWLGLKYNPLAIISCGICVVWMAGYLVRKGRPPKYSFSTKMVAWVTSLLLLANWIFVILTDHWFP